MESICPNCFVPEYNGRCGLCGYIGLAHEENHLLLTPGTMLNGRYVIGRALGAGGFGITYLVKDTQTNNLYAAKEYLPSAFAVRDGKSKHIYPSSSESAGIFEHGLQVFDKEAQSLRLFAGNPSIVQVYDSFRENGTAYFIMEYLDGVNLKILTRNMEGRLPITMAKEMLQSIGKTLTAVHQNGLLHRDVSPDNIFVTRQGGIKLIDFGATRFFIGENSRSLSVVLKPGFAPPEQYSSKGNQGPWTDVYALGATFLYLVSGRSLPDAPDRLAGASLDTAFDLAEMDMGLRAAIEKSLALNYRDRYMTAGEFLSDALAVHSEAHKHIDTSGNVNANSSTNTNANVVSDICESADSIMYSDAASAQGYVSLGGTPFVRLIRNGQYGDKWIIPANMDITIGRSADRCNIILDDPDISRTHCTVRYDDRKGVFMLVDISSNGTFLPSGERMTREIVHTIPLGGSFIMPGGKYVWEVGVE